MSAHNASPARPFHDTHDRTTAAKASDPVPFPDKTEARPQESWHADWRRRLAANLARRSDGRWDPLTWTHE